MDDLSQKLLVVRVEGEEEIVGVVGVADDQVGALSLHEEIVGEIVIKTLAVIGGVWSGSLEKPGERSDRYRPPGGLPHQTEDRAGQEDHELAGVAVRHHQCRGGQLQV